MIFCKIKSMFDYILIFKYNISTSHYSDVGGRGKNKKGREN